MTVFDESGYFIIYSTMLGIKGKLSPSPCMWNVFLYQANTMEIYFNKLCRGKAMATYAKPRQWKKEKSARLRREGDQIKFIDLRIEKWQVVGFRKARRIQDVP